MRCPTCGTENAPDSRFCGGCGARFTSASSRVAPTQKISDDTPFPPTGSMAGSPYVAQSVSHIAPPTMPRTVSQPPMAYAGAAPASMRHAAIDDPSLSMPTVARRPWGLIAIVLVIDLALAGAGAWMLSQGLGAAARPAAKSTN